MDSKITLYGADWCGHTARSHAHLEQRGIDFDYINIDHDSNAAEQVERWGHGKRKIPVIRIESNGRTEQLTEPTNQELDEALRSVREDAA